MDDLDRVMREGLGRRWAVIGPFETSDLNTRGGIAEHAKRMGPAYARMGAERGQDDPWDDELVAEVTAQRRALLPLSEWEQRVDWRDRALIAQEQGRRLLDSDTQTGGPISPTLPITSRAVASQPLSGARDELEAEEPQERSRDFNQSVARGLEIIETFGAATSRQTVSEVAAKTGLTRATARRFLLTLVELGYMTTDGRTFELSPRVLRLGYSYLSGLGFPNVALPHLEALVAEVDEASEASILDGHDVVYVVRVPGTRLMTIAVNVGSRMPAHATSMGRVLLAGLPDDELERYLASARLERFLPHTATDPDTQRERILKARADGFAHRRPGARRGLDRRRGPDPRPNEARGGSREPLNARRSP